MGKIGFVFPGQGAQYIGMGKEFYENFEECRKIYDEANELLGFDIKSLIFSGEAKELEITENNQPAILITAIAMFKILEKQGIKPDVVAGLSLGEYSALVTAGVMSLEEAVLLVRKRGKYMSEAVEPGKGAMAAILGLKADKINDLCNMCKVKGIIEVANYNCPGQIVVSGEKEAVEYAVEKCKEFGALKGVLLKVSGPFHSSMLDKASQNLACALKDVHINEPLIPYIANVNAEIITSRDDIKELLIKGVKSSVLWEDSVKKMIASGVDTIVEVGPGKTLSTLIKKIDRKVKVLNVEDINSLQNVIEQFKS